MTRAGRLLTLSFSLAVVSGAIGIAAPDGGDSPGQPVVTFNDVAANDGAGIDYRRVPSTTNLAYEALKHQATYTFNDLLATPDKPRGAPGVALFDYDNDGALDIFVTNGPGAGNSLYRNRIAETGRLEFVDVAAQAGVAEPAMDATGVCYGDVNNDGFEDLYVLGRNEPNRLWIQRGDGTFAAAGDDAGVGGGTYTHTSCSMGDINGDGWLDIAVANTEDWSNQLAIIAVPFELNQPNQLFLNLGDGHFADVSESSGFRTLAGLPPGVATISWAIAMVDYDLDGDIDIIHADDQGAYPRARDGGIDRGLVHLLRNDGTGAFSDQSVVAGTNKTGAWMGLAFGDFDSDGALDFFATNFGDYGLTALPFPYQIGDFTSRWFLGRPDGTFTDPGVGDLRVTPFGWGTSALDYDNDGATDVAFFGHIDVGLIIITDNPGVLLRNDGAAHFSFDAAALASTPYVRREVFGSAAGDLDNDGFEDLVTVSAMDIPESVPLTRFPVSLPPSSYGSPFDPTAYFVAQFTPVSPDAFVWNGYEFPNGTLQVQRNSGDNGNRSVQFRTRGSVGMLPGGRVNRDGIGATLTFTPAGGRPVMKPIVAGSSYASADSLWATFGLGRTGTGDLDVLWPGGVRNRLYGVTAGERLVFPEIPCSYRSAVRFSEYKACVETAVAALVTADVIPQEQVGRFVSSALRAYRRDIQAGPAATVEAAFVETIPFEAQLTANIPRFDRCDGGALICGTAHLSPFGDAAYTFTIDTLEPRPLACVAPSGTSTGGAYAATLAFTLPDGSTLTLAEEGLVCGPGQSLAAPSSWRTYGIPVDGSGRWSVRSATGQFSQLTGAGTDSFRTAGADFRISYVGALTR